VHSSPPFSEFGDCDNVAVMLPLRHPFTALVTGPTGSGKTSFVFKLIESADIMIDPPPAEIVYCYGEYQASFDRYPHVDFRQGLPDME